MAPGTLETLVIAYTSATVAAADTAAERSAVIVDAARDLPEDGLARLQGVVYDLVKVARDPRAFRGLASALHQIRSTSNFRGVARG